MFPIDTARESKVDELQMGIMSFCISFSEQYSNNNEIHTDADMLALAFTDWRYHRDYFTKSNKIGYYHVHCSLLHDYYIIITKT